MSTDEKDKKLSIVKSKVEDRIRDFAELLQSLEGLNDKKRSLWREIYINAVNDRETATNQLRILLGVVGESSTEYATHGRTIVSLIEKNTKSNDQLIKLADLVAAHGDKSIVGESADDLYSSFSVSDVNVAK